MMFDTSTNDIIATMPNGFGAGENGIRWIKTPAQTLAPQLKAVGITPADVKYIGISHNHADHTGNVYMFKNSIVLIQRREYRSGLREWWRSPRSTQFRRTIFERSHPVSLLDGDYDVFGDGSVILFYVGGHTLGQSGLPRPPAQYGLRPAERRRRSLAVELGHAPNPANRAGQ